MKPVLAIGLGNPLMGDDGVGSHVADLLAADPRLPESVEVVAGGADLLRYARWIEGRRRVVLVDAIQDGAEPGTVSVIEEGLEERQEHAHHLALGQAIALLRMTTPASFKLLGISVGPVRLGNALSPEIAARMPRIIDRVVEELK